MPLSAPTVLNAAKDYCPYADDFYPRAEAVLPVLLAEEEMPPEYLGEAARAELLCPFELALELSLYADLIVCDYNYAFDPTVYLRRFFWPGVPVDSLFLVDEAHNLVPRGREMYSATLEEREVRELKSLFRHASAALHRQPGCPAAALRRLARHAGVRGGRLLAPARSARRGAAGSAGCTRTCR